MPISPSREMIANARPYLERSTMTLFAPKCDESRYDRKMKRTPGHRRSQERRRAHGRNPRSDRHNLERDGGEALGDDDPYAPLFDQVLIGDKAVSVTVKLHKRHADQTPQSVAD